MEHFIGHRIRHAISGIALAAVFLLPVPASSQPYPYERANRSQAAEDYVRATLERGLGTLNDTSVPEAERRQNLQAFLRSFMDLRSVALFSFGLARRSATPEQTEKFVNAFQDYTVALYDSLLSRYYTGQSVRVAGGTQDGPNSYTVNIVLDNPNGGAQNEDQRIDIGVRVVDRQGKFSITDLAVGDIWLSTQEREEVNNYLLGNMGNIGGLILHYKTLTAQRQSQSPPA